MIAGAGPDFRGGLLAAGFGAGGALGLLSGGADSIAEIADKVGYDSEAAFSRAFKRNMGIAPATWRKSQRLAIAAE